MNLWFLGMCAGTYFVGWLALRHAIVQTYPELARDDCAGFATAAIRFVRLAKEMKRARVLAIIFGGVLFAGLVEISIRIWHDSWFGASTGAALLSLSIQYGDLFLAKATVRRHLRIYLRMKGIAICESCGYDLQGAPTARCPECGLTSAVPTP